MSPKTKITPDWEWPLQHPQKLCICFMWVPGSGSVYVCILFYNKNTSKFPMKFSWETQVTSAGKKKKKPEKEKTMEIAQEFCKKRSIRY